MIEGGFFEKKLGAQLTIADRQSATHVVIVGDEEVQKGEVTLRTMKTGAQEKIPFTQLSHHFQHLSLA